MPVRVMKLCGIETLIATNAAGGLNSRFKTGDIMMLKDHINIPGFTGMHPLKGPNDHRLDIVTIDTFGKQKETTFLRFGGRFFALNDCYDKRWRRLATSIARELKIDRYVHQARLSLFEIGGFLERQIRKCVPFGDISCSFIQGVYAMLGGPNFETVAELRMLRICGVDAVGMSTIPEVLVARHCGINVFAFSLITNECILEEDSESQANHEEVIEAAIRRKDLLSAFVSRLEMDVPCKPYAKPYI